MNINQLQIQNFKATKLKDRTKISAWLHRRLPTRDSTTTSNQHHDSTGEIATATEGEDRRTEKRTWAPKNVAAGDEGGERRWRTGA